MTLALALRCCDGLVLATDSRASGGPLGAADSSEKFLQVNRDVGIMTYGLAEPGYRTMRALVEQVRSEPGQYATAANIVEKASQIASAEFTAFVQANQQFVDEMVGFIIAGYDGNESGLFKVFHLDSTTGFVPDEQAEIVAAQWHLPVALSPYLAFPGMSVRQGTNLAVILMVLTSTFNPTVGGPIRLATVSIERGFSLLSDREVQELIETNQVRLAKLKMAWAEGWLAA